MRRRNVRPSGMSSRRSWQELRRQRSMKLKRVCFLLILILMIAVYLRADVKDRDIPSLRSLLVVEERMRYCPLDFNRTAFKDSV